MAANRDDRNLKFLAKAHQSIVQFRKPEACTGPVQPRSLLFARPSFVSSASFASGYQVCNTHAAAVTGWGLNLFPWDPAHKLLCPTHDLQKDPSLVVNEERHREGDADYQP
jgi:hypothetical protein